MAVYGKKHTIEARHKISETRKRLFKEGKLISHIENLGARAEKGYQPSYEEKERVRQGMMQSPQYQARKMLYKGKVKYPQLIQKVANLYQSGYSSQHIAKELSISIPTVKHYIRSEGIALRNIKESVRVNPKRHNSHSEEANRKRGLASCRMWQNPLIREKIVQKIQERVRSKEGRENASKKSKANWQDQAYREKVIRASLKALFETRPTSLEREMQKIIEKNKLPYKYIGDGSFLIGYKNPDFININGEKKCIEVYNPYFKIRDFGSCEKYEEERGKFFAKYGWRTFFFRQAGNKKLNEEIVVATLKVAQ